MLHKMSDILDFYLPQRLKVKAKNYKVSQDGHLETECRKFYLNLESASYTLLRNQIARMFNITGEFSMRYESQTKGLVLLATDWDFDAAIAEDPDHHYLKLVIQPVPIDQYLDEWDIICPADILPLEDEKTKRTEHRSSLADSILNEVLEAVHRVQRVLSFEGSAETANQAKLPMTHAELKNFLDSDGRLVKPRELHLSVFQGGIEPSLRPNVWKYLLNVFPRGLTLKERNQYLKAKSTEYYRLRYRWQRQISTGDISESLEGITNLVRKDVRRTDRLQKFYSGSDDNKNILSLFNILTTYAVTHPSVMYCQGMSDLLSPILYVMKNEAYAYICFCGLMKRMAVNFSPSGHSIKMKFRHLRKMLQHYDRELFLYLKEQSTLDLLFCYRWFLLELKREFSYNEALQILEIMWGSLPPNPPKKELELCEKFITLNCSDSDLSLHKNNIIYIDNHFSSSPNKCALTQSSLSNAFSQSVEKLNSKAQKKSFAQVTFNDSSIEEEEIKLPIYYRKRKYRSYTATKLSRLSNSFATKKINIPSPKPLYEYYRSKSDSVHFGFCQSWSCGEDFMEKPSQINAVYTAREFLRTQWCYSNTVNELQLNNWLNGKWFDRTSFFNNGSNLNVTNSRQRHGSSDSNYSTNSEDFPSDSESTRKNHDRRIDHRQSRRSNSEGYISDTASSVKGSSTTIDENSDSDEDDCDNVCDFLDSMSGSQYEEALQYFCRKREILPPPHVLGNGNPFLLFLCITMLTNKRDDILKKKMDFDEISMFFDKLVRKHKVQDVLPKARNLFNKYLNMGWNECQSDSETDDSEI